MAHLVGFFDILGTSEMVKGDIFSDSHILDFSNAVGLAALDHPAFRFAVFSDTVIISCNANRVSEFISVVKEMHSHWFADYIFVRGGIALGEIQWVDCDVDKQVFSKLPNFSHARVYGKALIEAYNLERQSGPGMLCFVSENAANLFSKAVPGSIFSSLSHILVWMPPEKLDKLRKIFKSLTEGKGISIEAQRHFLTTNRFLEQIRSRK